MCLKLTRILNKGYRPLDFTTSKYIDCDCGHCAQCRLKRSSDFSFRLQQEIYNNKDILPIFLTLTYSPAYRPYIEYLDDDGKIQSISCWNITHVQRFHKRVLRKLSYYYDFPSDSFKYLCACERGSDNEYIDDCGRMRIAQQCPHYHLVYLLYGADSLQPVRMLPKDFYIWMHRNYDYYDKYYGKLISVRSFFHYLLQKEWYYGRIKDIEITRSVASCTRYVTKYISKQVDEKIFDIPFNRLLELYDLDDRQRRSDFADRMLNGKVKSKKLCPAPIKFSHILPHSFSSNNIGMSLFSKLDVGETKSLFLKLALSDEPCIVVGSKKSSKIPLPYYYIKKFTRHNICLPYNLVLSRYNGHRIEHIFTSRFFRKVECWNNCQLYYYENRLKTYSLSVFSRFGNYVKKKLFAKRIDRLVQIVNQVRFNFGFFDSLHDFYLSLPLVVKNGISLFYRSSLQVSKSILFLNRKNTDIRRILPDFLHADLYSDNVKLPECYYHLSNILNFYRLCRTTFNYLRQLEYDKNYLDRLPQAVLQDPELFINNFIPT